MRAPRQFSRSRRGFAAASAGLAAALAVASRSAAADGDWQQWTEISWTQTLGNGLDLGLRWEGHWEEDLSRFAYHEVEPMLLWRWSPRWDFGVGYERDERWVPMAEVTHVPNVAATFRLPRQPWKLLPALDWRLTNRSRLDFLLPEDAAREWRPVFRNRTEWETRWRWGSKELVPFLFEEWLLDLRAGAFAQNRLGVGLGIPLLPHWLARIYAMRLDEKIAGVWEWHPVVGVQVQTQF